MLLTIPDVLTADQVAEAREHLARADWVDGRVTAGHQSARVKDNRQLPEDHPAARALGEMILAALQRNPLFISAALPLRIFPPLFNRTRADSRSAATSTTPSARSPARVSGFARTFPPRSFSAEPDEYDGGELAVEDTYGVHTVKLPAGDMVLYPSASLHHVRPVTRGARIASFFWIQSLVRDDGQSHAALRSRYGDSTLERGST